MLYGRNSFSQDMDEASIVEAVQEGRVQDLRAGLRKAEPRLITKLSDVSYFETKFTHLMGLYTTIKGLKQEDEEMQFMRQRLCTCLHKDLLDFYKEVNEEVEGLTASSVVKDLLEQLSSLNKRLLDIKIMADSEPNIPPGWLNQKCQSLSESVHS